MALVLSGFLLGVRVKVYLAYLLVVSLGLILMGAFFKPWLPEWLYGVCLTAYEPDLFGRILEGITGVYIFGFGLERVVFTLRRS